MKNFMIPVNRETGRIDNIKNIATKELRKWKNWIEWKVRTGVSVQTGKSEWTFIRGLAVAEFFCYDQIINELKRRGL